jgi:RHS repeat-associated protein
MNSEGRITKIYMNDNLKEQLIYDQKNHDNGLDHLTQAENDNCLTHFHYDKNGRAIHKSLTIKNIQKTYEYSQTFNDFQCLEAITFHDQKQIQYQYDQNHRLSTIQFNGKKLVGYDYYPNNMIQSIQYANGCCTTYTYERDILMKHMQVKSGDGKLIYQQTYTYDQGGNLIQIKQDDLFWPQMLQTRTYSYNTKNEIIAVQINQKQNYYQYAYDSVGNRIRFTDPFESDPKDNFIIDTDSDQLMKRIFSRSHINFSYDAMGNLIQKQLYTTVMTSPVKTINYQYNYQGMLSSVDHNSIRIAQYAYDTQKQRIFSAIKGKERIFHWDLSGNIIGEGTPEKDFVIRYLNMGYQKMVMIRSDQTEKERLFYFVNTPQGSPVLILDDKGNIVQRMQMDAFGNVERIVSIFNNEIYYTGKKYDPETGLYYFHNRYYDPELGRFISPDPAMQFLNPFTYAENNPLRYVDPDGEFLGVFLVGMAVGYLSHGFSTGDWFSEDALKSAAIGGVASVAGWAAGGYAIGLEGSELIAQVGYGISSGAAYGATQGGLKYIAYTDHFEFNGLIDNTVRGAIYGGASGGITAGGMHLLSNFFKDSLQEQIQLDIGNIKIPTKKMLNKYLQGAKDVTIDETLHFFGQPEIGKITLETTYQEALQQWGYYAITQLILNEDGKKAMDKYFRNNPIQVRFEHKF